MADMGLPVYYGQEESIFCPACTRDIFSIRFYFGKIYVKCNKCGCEFVLSEKHSVVLI